jgi:hypothetical protein
MLLGRDVKETQCWGFNAGQTEILREILPNTTDEQNLFINALVT